jgi:hypothetical protein
MTGKRGYRHSSKSARGDGGGTNQEETKSAAHCLVSSNQQTCFSFKSQTEDGGVLFMGLQ